MPEARWPDPAHRDDAPGSRAAAVVLAAGGSRRFLNGGGARHKLVTMWRDRPLVTWAVNHALEAGFERTWVVTGALALDALLPSEAEVVDNPQWAEGQATSLQVGVGAAREAGFDAVVVGLGDQPLVPASAWRRLGAARGVLAVATYGGRRRNPVRLGAAVWDLLPESGDEGARAVMRSHPELVTEVACDGDPADIDTVEDLGRWN